MGTRTELGKKITEELEEFRKYVNEGHWSWNLLGLAGGLALIFGGVWQILFGGLDIFMTGFAIFIIAFGLIAITLEYKQTFLPVSWVEYLKEDFLFIYKPYGRAQLYFFVGFLLVTQW